MESIARTGRGGWQENEITQLREAVRRAGGNGEPLRGVFEQIGASLGRKPNSVRNYYYACLKREEAGNVPHAAPFQTFTQDEVRQLVHDVLAARAQGVSVRACVQRMAGGNRKNMLRFQNKYRSVLKTRPALVRQVIEDMRASGEATFDPYAAQSAQAGGMAEDELSRLNVGLYISDRKIAEATADAGARVSNARSKRLAAGWGHV